MKQPLVSILINNYNNAPFLEECVRSALEQTYPHTEVIVYDDGSTDASLDILRAFGKDIVLLAPNPNFGARSINFNQAHAIWRAFQASRGDIVCLLDGDDAFLPTKVERVVDAFRTGTPTLVQHLFTAVDERGKVVEPRRPARLIVPTREGFPSYRAFILRYHCLFHLFLQTSALSFPRPFLQKHLPIPPDPYDKLWADFRLSRRAAFEGSVVTLEEPLAL
ncbi:MAG: glycosyltransferase, partial [Bacteroidetes bacterium]